MSSGWPLEARLQLLHEVFLVIGEAARIHNALGPQRDAYWLTRAIMQDEVFATSNKKILIQVLKKSPVWPKVLIFLENDEKKCKRKNCHCYAAQHVGNIGICKGTHSHYSSYHFPNRWETECQCLQYIPSSL